MQIRQSMDMTYPHPRTLEKLTAHRCVVVTSGKIQVQARKTLSDLLERDGLREKVELIDGEKLWIMVKTHLNPDVVHEAFNAIAKYSNEAHPIFKLNHLSVGESLLYWVTAKDGSDVSQIPLMNMNCHFDSSEVGRAKAAEFKEFIERGLPLNVSNDFIESFTAHEFVKPIMMPDGEPPDHVIVWSAPYRYPGAVQLVFESTDDTTAIIPYLEVWRERAGSKEVVYSNSRQKYPLQIQIVHTVLEKGEQTTLTMSIERKGSRIIDLLSCYQFAAKLSAPGLVSIRGLQESDWKCELPIKGGFFANAEKYLVLLKKLAEIEKWTDVKLIWPDRELNESDVRSIFSWHESIERGEFDVGTDYSVTALFRPADKNHLRKMSEGGFYALRLWHEEFLLTLIGNEINLGSVEFAADKMKLSEESIRKLKNRLKQSQVKDDEVVFKAVEGAKVRARLPRFSNSPTLLEPEMNAEIESKFKHDH